MAETKKDDTKSLADRLVSDPKNPPDLSMLQGWLGASSEDKHRRLYLDPELSQSLEIPEDAIVHTQDIPTDVNPLGGSWVWVKADAAIKQGPGLERMYARFLRGQIQQDFFAAAGAGGAAGVGGGTVGGPGPGAATNPLICPVQTVFNCATRQAWCRPSVFTICPSQLTICPTRPIICQVVTQSIQCVPSAAVQCPTRFCPSAVDACPSAPGGCFDPTIFQQTIAQTVVQPGIGQGGFQPGMNFDPGAVAGGFVGAPVTQTPGCQLQPPVAAATQFVVCNPSVIQICPTRSPICITRPLIQCRSVLTPWCPPLTIPGPQCPNTWINICTQFPQCPIFTQPPQCPIPTQLPQCGFPSLPGGCPSGFACGDPGGGGQVINPAVQGGGFDPNMAFDPTGGAVGAPMGQRVFPSALQICWTRLPVCQVTMASHCPQLCWL